MTRRNKLIRAQLERLQRQLANTPRDCYNERTRLHNAIRRKRQRLNY